MNLKSVPVTIMLGAIGLAALVALGWFALVSPALGAISANGEARLLAQDRANGMNVQLMELRRQAEDLPETDKQARELDQLWPATADQPGFFAQVTEAADAAGIAPDALTVLSPGVPVIAVPAAEDGAVAPAPADGTVDPSAEVPVTVSDVANQEVTIEAEGDYDELTEFLAELESMDRSFLIVTSSFASDPGSTDRPTISVVGKTFVAPPLDPASGS